MGSDTDKIRGIKFDGVTPFLAQYLYEAQEKADCEFVLGRSKVWYYCESDSVVNNYFAVGYCIAVLGIYHLAFATCDQGH